MAPSNYEQFHNPEGIEAGDKTQYGATEEQTEKSRVSIINAAG